MTGSSIIKPTYSFDVFDTCVTRMFAYPRDLFFELGLRLAPSNAGVRKQYALARKFQVQRIRAEKAAYRHARHGGPSATLEQIYLHFRQPRGFAVSAAECQSAELALELESTYPIPETVSEINALRASGARIIFISDMYLPAQLLARLLKHHGIMQEGDGLYVSCDAGVSKRGGGLYAQVLGAEGIAPTQLRHHGDDPHVDIEMAARSGIEAIRVARGRLLDAEQASAGRRLPRDSHRTWASAFARRLRLLDAAGPPPPSPVLAHVIRSIAVPLLLAYVVWVLDDAVARGVKRLYFVSRDGEVLLAIAKSLRAHYPDVDLRYLYGSRRAWLPSSISSANADWRSAVIVDRQKCAPADIVGRMGLSPVDADIIRQSMGFSTEQWDRNHTIAHANAFLDKLYANAEARELVNAAAAAARWVSMTFFEQEGMLQHVPWALVDTGWALNAQAALKRTFAYAGSKVEPQGYYLGLAQHHLDQSAAGPARAFLATGSIFARRSAMFEHTFTPARHPSVVRYEVCGAAVHAVFGTDSRVALEKSYADCLHRAATVGGSLVSTDNNVAKAIRRYTPDIIRHAEELLADPTAAEAAAFASFRTFPDMRQDDKFSEPLCRPISIGGAIGMIVAAMVPSRKRKLATYRWIEGSLALSPRYIRLPLQLLRSVR